jgi:hypothetical protein
MRRLSLTALSVLALGPLLAACGGGGSSIVFATTKSYSGNLGGVAGGDAKCNELAVAAKRPGTYRAWLGTSTGTAADHIVGNGPWYGLGPGGSPNIELFANHAALNMGPKHSILVDETGGYINAAMGIWTGTDVGGFTVAGNTCEDWTSETASGEAANIGFPDGEPNAWSTYGHHSQGCDGQLRLYCFGD